MDVTGLRSLCEAFQRTANAHPDAPALRAPGGTPAITWREYAERVRRVAAGLHALGVRRGDAVGLMLLNRPEFHLVDTGAMHLGAAPFSVYNTSPAGQIAHVLRNAGARVVICEANFVDRVRAAGGAVEHIVVIEGALEGTLSLAELEGMSEGGFDFDGAWRAVQPEDLLTLIYTSGTTGPPKGVELTHANMIAQIAGLDDVMTVHVGDRMASYLPSAHVADRWISHYVGMIYGLDITSVPDARRLFAVLPEVRPTLFGGVPRVFEKLQAGLEARFAAEPDPQKAAGVMWALEVGRRKVAAEQAARAGTGPGPDQALLTEYADADRMVWAPVRTRLGLDRVRTTFGGAAAFPPDVLEFFGAIGLPINELWGMSELACLGASNRDGSARHGTVGPAIPGIEMRIAEDGELLCRGGMVMRGYRNDPTRTAEAIDADGWLHTGDIGSIDADGYLTIVDRKKELIINSAGKNMSPANIEGTVKSASPLIGQVAVIGDGRPYNVALIVLDPDASAAYAARRGLPDSSPAALSADDDVRKAIGSAVDLANARLSRVEQVKRFTVLPVDWLPAGDELTPTMKLRRRPIAKKYAALIEAMYAAPTSI
ncbi:AMP-dependent synthetase/ligase [Pseudonocardia sp.]|uniref:AMP-dependent synthetase/ligase n=1 Tax=Pseudonocardia sp. TaxID=60912 RepID=UPI003D0FC450